METQILLVIINSGSEEEFPLGDGLRVVVVEAGGHGKAGGLAAELLPPKVVEGLSEPLLQPGRQLTGLTARRAEHSVTSQLLL